MSPRTARAEQALRDLIDLEQQEAAGEISAADATRLRRRFEQEVASALDESNSPGVADPADQVTPAAAVRPGEAAAPRRWQPQFVLYLIGLLAVIVGFVQLVGFLSDRPVAGMVTGNEAVQRSTPAPSASATAGWTVDPGDVTDAELEAVVAANPEVVGMRLALADRYQNEGRFDLAAVHYRRVLEQEPDNPDANAHLGWILLNLDLPQEAAARVDRARAANPQLLDAMWFQANIRLYGLNDPRGAVQVLDEMAARTDLTPQVRRQVIELRQAAAERTDGTR